MLILRRSTVYALLYSVWTQNERSQQSIQKICQTEQLMHSYIYLKLVSFAFVLVPLFESSIPLLQLLSNEVLIFSFRDRFGSTAFIVLLISLDSIRECPCCVLQTHQGWLAVIGRLQQRGVCRCSRRAPTPSSFDARAGAVRSPSSTSNFCCFIPRSSDNLTSCGIIEV